jgi:quercetin dioxygenase-like cupin family protein
MSQHRDATRIAALANGERASSAVVTSCIARVYGPAGRAPDYPRGVEPGVSLTGIDWESGERFLSLRRPLGVTSFGLNQLTLQPGQRGRIHRHREQEEVYLVLRGTLTVICEGEEHELGEGQLLRVAPQVRRQLVNAGDRPCVLVAIGGTGEHVGRDGEAFSAWSESEGRPPQEVPLPDDLPSSG